MDFREFEKQHPRMCAGIRTDAIEKFAHELKETMNQEFPRNYQSTQPFFTLENVRLLIDEKAEEMKM